MSIHVETDTEADGRWTVMPSQAETPPKRAWEEPAVQRVATRTIARRQLDEGYEVVLPDGSVERREYRVLAYIVREPDTAGGEA